MNLQRHLQSWQTLLDDASGGNPISFKRAEVTEHYKAPDGMYLFFHPCEANNFALTEYPNGSPIKGVTAMRLLTYASNRLSPMASIQQEWDVELIQDEDNTFAVSCYNRLGARITIHGIVMTTNWCGIVSERGIITQC